MHSVTKLLNLCGDAFSTISGDSVIRDVRNLAEAVLSRSNLLERTSQRSYFHPLGYHKLVLAEGADGSRLRLHKWNSSSDYDEDVHDHYWDFRSVVALGALAFTNFEEAEAGDLYDRYAMIPRGAGAFELSPRGEARLSIQSRIVVRAGNQTVLPAAQLHSTRCVEDCWSIVMQTPARRSTNVVMRRRGSRGMARAEPNRLDNRLLRNLLEEFREISPV